MQVSGGMLAEKFGLKKQGPWRYYDGLFLPWQQRQQR